MKDKANVWDMMELLRKLPKDTVFDFEPAWVPVVNEFALVFSVRVSRETLEDMILKRDQVRHKYLPRKAVE